MALVDVIVESGEWEARPGLAARLETAAKAALDASGVQTSPQGEIAILLTDDEGVAILNERWRGKPQATNVLSWPAVSPKLLSLSPMIGDIAIAFETCAREAAEEAKSLDDHVSHLVVHGVLHLLGFDHETEEEAERMEALERVVLARLGIADPYASRDHGGVEA